MKKTEQIKSILKSEEIENTLRLISKWGNLTLKQIAMLLGCSERQAWRNVLKLEPYEYLTENKGLGLICYKKFPHSAAKLFCATGLGLRALGYLKEIKKEKGRIVKTPRWQTKFNFYEDEHTTWCIKALNKHLGKGFSQKAYITPRNMTFSWSDIYSNIKEIWSSTIEARRPDLVVQKDKDKVCIEVEYMPKSDMRMRIILRSLMALGDYAKRFNKTIIYANDKNKTYTRWCRLVPYVEDNHKPKILEIRKLSELD